MRPHTDDWVEAQIYGGVDLATDVAEIRYVVKDTSGMSPERKRKYKSAMAGLKALAKALPHIEIKQLTPNDAVLAYKV